MKMPIVFNIQKFSIHDGPGVRTTIFFKGCPIRCAWCHNPESQSYKIETMHKKNGKEEIIGKEYTVNELIKEAMKDQLFYEQSGGGVTLSGGEVMSMDIDYLTALCQKLHRYGITITIDTCGYAPYENYEKLLPYVDTFLYDIKTTNDTLHKKYIGADSNLILSNLVKLNRAGAKLYIRIPVIKEVNGNDEDLNATIRFLKENHINARQINLLPYHNTGSAKYARLGIAYEGEDLHAPSKEEMEHFVSLFTSAGFANVKIGG